jgi:hypothetical protein
MTSAKQLASKVEDFTDDLEDNIDDGLDDGMQTTTNETRRNLESNDSVVHGNLLDSIEFNRNVMDGYLFSAQTEIGAKHAPFVEYGTGSHQDPLPPWADVSRFKSPDPAPPKGKIRQWIIRKGITTNDPSLRSVNLMEEQSRLASIIRQTIAEYGNRAHPFARPAARHGFDVTTRNIEREMRKSLRRF